MHKDEINKCLDNPFSLKLLNEWSRITKEIYKKEGFHIGKNNYHILSEKEKYNSRIFQLECDLITTIEQIEHIKVFLARIPYKRYLWNNSIDQLSYIRYHLEVLYHKVHTVLDIMKLLINEVYYLEINGRDCSWNRIKTKVGDDIEPMKIINQYYEVFKSILEFRHLNTHKGYFEDKEMEDVNFTTGYGLLKLYNIFGHEPDEEIKSSISKHYIDYRLNQFRKDKLLLINNIQKLIFGFSKRFLSSLNAEYNNQLNNIR
jgi:hypothetical protein